MIINHQSPEYQKIIQKYNTDVALNGEYFYSEELCNNIIPYIKTDYNWVTINCGVAMDHSIVFIHNNNDPHSYDFLKDYKDLILVVSQKKTKRKVKYLSDKVIYLPLSVDVEYIKKFRKNRKPHNIAFVGRRSKRFYKTVEFNEDCDYLEGMERPRLLNHMALYKRVYAVGRCAIEAKILGCEVLPYDSRYPDPSVWVVLDNSEVIPMLQKELDKLEVKNGRDASKSKRKDEQTSKGTRKNRGLGEDKGIINQDNC